MKTPRLYALLLRCYPPSFRARFESGMRYAFAREADHARAAGAGAYALFWATAVLDAIRYGLAERRSARVSGTRLPAEGGRTMKSWLTLDWRDGWRSLRATPLVTVVAVLSLGLGIGANTALFSILNALMFKSLPVHEPERLVLIDQGPWTNPIWESIRARQSDLVDGAFAWSAERFDLSSSGTDMVDGVYASGGMFDVLGIRPVRGRLFGPSDDVRRGGPGGPVAVISHAFWQARYGGAEDAIGRMLTVERVPFTIVGVAPRGFFGPDVGRSFDVAIPLGAEPLIRGEESALDGRLSWWLNIMLRLKPGQRLDDAATRLNTALPQIRAETQPVFAPGERSFPYLSEPLTLAAAGNGRSPLRTRYERPLTTIMIVVGMVLLIACANIANLMLARAVSRRHELSVRLALGASRLRLSRQLLVESLMLTGLGTAVGLVFAHWGGRALVAQLATPANLVTLDLSPDWRVAGFTAAVGGLATLLFGLAPAIGVSGLSPHDAIKERGRGAAGGGRLGLRSALVVMQVALSLTLVTAAGLFLRTFVTLATRDLGFDRRSTLVVNVRVPPAAVAPAQRLALFGRVRDAAAAVPGVGAASLSFTTPIAGPGWNSPVAVPGSNLGPRERMTWINVVSPEWFSTFGVRLAAGRMFDGRDRGGAPLVAIVNKTFAARFIAGTPAIGARFTLQGGRDTTYEVVGVVEDTAYRAIRGALPATVFTPVAQWDDRPASIALGIRSAAGPPAQLTRAIAAAVTREAPDAVLSFRTVEDQVRAALTQERLVATLSAFFGGLALLLAGLGLYGLTSYTVSRRRAEIGIRLALGATSRGVVRLVLLRLAWLVAIGLVLGAGLSAWGARYVGTLVYGLQPQDPTTIAVAASVLGIVAAIAGWLPARRASRVDPVIVLRME